MAAARTREKLISRLCSSCEILEGQDHARILRRRSEHEYEEPAFIVRPCQEERVARTVKTANEYQTKFVIYKCGHSPFSNAPADAFILDLSWVRSGVTIDANTKSACIRGAVEHKTFQTVLTSHGRYAPIAAAQTVGEIPFHIGGGHSVSSGKLGFACENILSARIVTAAGDIVFASPDHHADLFWAICGAGQFFGVVLDLTVKTFPMNRIGSATGEHLPFQAHYDTKDAEHLCRIINEKILMDECCSEHLMVTNEPPAYNKCVVALYLHYLGKSEGAESMIETLAQCRPIWKASKSLAFENHSDLSLSGNHYGDYKWIHIVGLRRPLTGSLLIQWVHCIDQLCQECPGARRVNVIVAFRGPRTHGMKEVDTSFGNADQRPWLNIRPWFKDKPDYPNVLEFQQQILDAAGHDTTLPDSVTYTNCCRSDPITARYKGRKSIERLRMVKHMWDINGAFSRIFLDD